MGRTRSWPSQTLKSSVLTDLLQHFGLGLLMVVICLLGRMMHAWATCPDTVS